MVTQGWLKNETTTLENTLLTSLCSLSEKSSLEETETTQPKGNYALMILLDELKKEGLC